MQCRLKLYFGKACFRHSICAATALPQTFCTLPMRILYIALCTLLVQACKVDNADMAAPKTAPNYLHNKLSQPVYVNILYTPGQQGINFANMALLRQVVVPAGATVPLGDSLMQQNKPYMLDWHSADYRYHNLLLRLPAKYSPFNYYPMISDSTEVLDGQPGQSRLYCLGGNGKATYWQSANAYNGNGVSVWDTLMSKKYHSVYMDIMGHYADTARLYPGQVTMGKNDMVKAQYMVQDSGRVWITADNRVLTNDARPYAQLHTTSPDSLYLLIREAGAGPAKYKEPYLLLVRSQTIPLK